MSVKIRFKQTGSRNRRSFRIVAVDESKKRDGVVIEELGYFDPNTKPAKVEIKKDRIEYWQKVGGQITSAVAEILKTL